MAAPALCRRFRGGSSRTDTPTPCVCPSRTTELDELFLESDGDGDGSLSRDEFAAAMTADWGALCACDFGGSGAAAGLVGAADVGAQAATPAAPAPALASSKL